MGVKEKSLPLLGGEWVLSTISADRATVWVGGPAVDAAGPVRGVKKLFHRALL